MNTQSVGHVEDFRIGSVQSSLSELWLQAGKRSAWGAKDGDRIGRSVIWETIEISRNVVWTIDGQRLLFLPLYKVKPKSPGSCHFGARVCAVVSDEAVKPR